VGDPRSGADRRSTAGSTRCTEVAGTTTCSANAPTSAAPTTRSPTARPPPGAERPDGAGELAARRERDGHVDLVAVGHQQHVGIVDRRRGHIHHHLASEGSGSSTCSTETEEGGPYAVHRAASIRPGHAFPTTCST